MDECTAARTAALIRRNECVLAKTPAECRSVDQETDRLAARIREMQTAAARERQVADRAEREASRTQYEARKKEDAEARAKEDRVRGVRRELAQVIDPRYGGSIDSREKLSARAGKARDMAESVRSVDAAAADELAAQVAAFERGALAFIEAEERCTATPACVADRMTPGICKTIENRKMWQEAMAEENRNPSGYVNKTYLHSLGSDIQAADREIARSKSEYAKAVKRAFSESACAKR